MTIAEIGQPTWYKPDNVLQVGIYVWNTNTLAWERSTGGGGSGTTVSVDNFPATQSVSATNLDIRDLVFASDKVDASGSSISISGSVPVTGPLTDAQLRAVAVPVSGTVSASVSGSVTANAGTNLNTSALALESGGNLATIAGKDFATQTTLSALNTKVIVADTSSVTVISAPITAVTNAGLTALNGAISGTEMQVDVLTMPPVTVTATDLDIRDLAFVTDKVDVSGSAVTAVVTNAGTFETQIQATATEEPPEYTEEQIAALSLDLFGYLRTLNSGLVSDTASSYISGQRKPLSINTEGRLKVSTESAPTYLEFFLPFDFGQNIDIRALSNSPWSALS